MAPDYITNFHLNALGNVKIVLLFLGQESHDPASLMRIQLSGLGPVSLRSPQLSREGMLELIVPFDWLDSAVGWGDPSEAEWTF